MTQSKRRPPLEKFVNETQRLLRAVIRQETVRVGQRAKIAQQQAAYRLQRAERERKEAEKNEAQES